MFDTNIIVEKFAYTTKVVYVCTTKFVVIKNGQN